MILFKKREKNVNAEIGKEEKMTETEIFCYQEWKHQMYFPGTN